MTAITLEDLETKHQELAVLIAQFRATSKPCTIDVSAASIKLRTGERYAGLLLDAEGKPVHHLILLPDLAEDVAFDDAMEWAKGLDAELPTRQEQSLLYANCKLHLKPQWHWTGDEHESEASYAWFCSFSYGSQSSTHKGAELCAVAVRRIKV